MRTRQKKEIDTLFDEVDGNEPDYLRNEEFLPSNDKK